MSDKFPVFEGTAYTPPELTALERRFNTEHAKLLSQQATITELIGKLTATEKGCRILGESLKVSDFRIKSLKATITDLTAALGALVALKAHKDIRGKDDHYTRNQPAAWEQARAALKEKPDG